MQEVNLNTPKVEPEDTKVPDWPPKTQNLSLIVMFSAPLLVLIGVVAFLYFQNQQLLEIIAAYQSQTAQVPIVTPTPTSTPVYIPIQTASPSATVKPVSTSPKSSVLKVASPYNLTGTVPAGWMSEGLFPIKLLDASRNLIVQTQGREKVPGSWQSGNPVSFTATLTFTTAAKSGFLVFGNDNPSGDPTKSQSFEVPVIFQ